MQLVRIVRTLLAVAAIGILGAPASAALVASYNFDGGGNNSAEAAASAASAITGVSAGAISRTNQLGGWGHSDGGTFGANQVLDSHSSAGVTAFDASRYWSFTITIDAATTIDINSLAFKAAKGGTSARSFAITSSVTGSTKLLAYSTDENLAGTADVVLATDDIPVKPTLAPITLDLTGYAAFKNLTNTTVTFFVTNWVSTGTAGRQVFFDDVQVDATAVIPEPAAMSLLSAGSLLLMRRRRDAV